MCKSTAVLFGLLGVLFGSGCDEASCPPDYPVMRDGFCYGADGSVAMDGGVEPTDAGPQVDAGPGADAGPGVDSGGGGGDDAGPVDAAPPICTGTHPIVEGTRRYCEAGDCFCGDPDNCFPDAIAAACCNEAVVCGDADAGPPNDAGGTDGGGVICTGTHPIVEGDLRYCEAGDCYCGDPDNCFPDAIAAACCNEAVVCE